MSSIKIKPSSKIKNKKIQLESKYISLINSLSYSIKELYLNFTKIIKALKANVLEQNNYIFVSKCLINELNDKSFIHEKYQNFFKNIEGLNITNKYIINNISNFEESSTKFFQKSKLIFKRMKELENSKINIISQRNHYLQNNLNSLIKRNNNLFSSDENLLEQGTFTSKTNNIKSNSSRKKICINLNKNREMINIYSKKPKLKKYEINTGDIIYLTKKILTGKNKKRYLNHSQDEIITETNHKLKKKNFFIDTTPHKSSSWSKDRIISNSNLNSLKKVRKNESMISNKYYIINNNIHNKNKPFKTFKSDSFLDKNNCINNYIEFIENIIEYFYLLRVSQNNIISESNKINLEEKVDLLLKQSLIKLNYSIFIISDFFNEKMNLKRKLNFILNQNENFEQKLKNIISRKDINKNKIIVFRNLNNEDKIKGNRDKLINAKELDYIQLINKLRNDNNNLAIINQKIISENKLLLNQLSLFQNIETNNFEIFDDSNNNNKIEQSDKIQKLIKENKEYKQIINSMKKDKEKLCQMIKKINNNDNKQNSSYFLNNSQISNIINYNTDVNNNSCLNKKNNESENLKNLMEENKILKIKLNEKAENNEIKKLTKDIENLRYKSNLYVDSINEKDSIIKQLNSDLDNLKNELEESRNNYENLKKEQEKNKSNKEKELKQLELLVEQKNNEIKKLKDEENNKTIYLKEKINLINELDNSNKKLEKEKNELNKKFELQTQEIKQLDSIINVLNEKIKILGKNENNEIINSDNYNNNESHSKRMSTPSFKSPDEDVDEINNLKNENKILLNKISKYEESIFNNNNPIINIENINDINKKDVLQTKIKKLFNSDEFIILKDISFKNLKWYLLKKKNIDEENSDIESYENLIWAPSINIIDLEKFEYEESTNNSEIMNLIKKLEEKEKINSRLSYKLSKLEKESVNINKVHNSTSNDINEEKIKTEENFIPIEKYNNILQKLNTSESIFEKIQKENIELMKYKKLYLELNDNNPINKINVKNSEEDKNNSNSNDEIDFYKKKSEELQMLLSVLKEGIKNILMKLVIPKKEKGEIKQILKLFEFTKDETSFILGDK